MPEPSLGHKQTNGDLSEIAISLSSRFWMELGSMHLGGSRKGRPFPLAQTHFW